MGVTVTVDGELVEKDVTELVELLPDRLDGVGSPANGSPFLLIKAAADDHQSRRHNNGGSEMTLTEDVTAKAQKAARKAVKKQAKKAARRRVAKATSPRPNLGGALVARQQVSAGVDETQILACDAAVKALRELEARPYPPSPQALSFAKEQAALGKLKLAITMRGQGRALGGQLAKSQLSKSQAELTLGIQRNLTKLRQHFESLPAGSELGSPAERRQFFAKASAGENLSRLQIACKDVPGVADRALAEAQAAVGSVRTAQQTAMVPQHLGPLSEPRRQLQSVIDSDALVQSLGSPGAGANRGDFTGPNIGVHDEPTTQGYRQLSNEYSDMEPGLAKRLLGDRLGHMAIVMQQKGWTFAKSDMQDSLRGEDQDMLKIVGEPMSASDLSGVVGSPRPEYVNV